MNKIGYAVVGTGYFGAELGRIINNIEGAYVSAVYDPVNADEIAKELNCDVETDLDEMYSREDVQAVIVASPNYLHKEPVIKAAEHNVQVFCEKPIALSYEDCDQMVIACKKNEVTFMAGHVMNFFNGVRKAKQMINEGKIGKVLYCHSARNGWEEPQESISWKKIRSKSGGHLYHHIHELDLIQFIMGAPSSAYMTGGNVAHKGEQFGDEDDMLLINLEFPNETFAVLEYGSAFRWSEHYLLIQGSLGAIKIDMHDVGMTVKTEKGVEKHLVHANKEEDEERTKIYNDSSSDGAIMYGSPDQIPPQWLHTIMKKEMLYFHDILTGGEASEEFKPLLDGEAAKSSIATADACTKSLLEKRVVQLSEITGK